MNIVQAEENLKKITTKFSKESFIFDLMQAYGFPNSTISKLKIKLKKNPDEDIIVTNKLHFLSASKKELDSAYNKLLKSYSTAKKQPRFIIVTDFQTIKAYDTKMGESLNTEIKSLLKYPDFFLPWAGIEKKVFQGENPADVKAAEKLAKVFDLIRLDNIKYEEKNRHALNVFLTRVLFCFFAEDTDIFPKGLFTESIASHTKADGSDLDTYLLKLFEVLNKKSRNGLPEYLREFPYVNGGLFAEEHPIPKFSKRSRESLIDLGSDLNWAEINPDIFGSMIQAVVHPDQRAGLGMHYTSVTNIMKVIEPLFLTELYEEFERTKSSKPKLRKLLERVSRIKIFDPACGSGNFLIIAYKELRSLEMKILKSIGEIPMSGISLSNFYGIEIDDFAHEVAKLSLWLAEHQMDVLFNNEFGNVKASLPLKETGRIVCGNATRLDWEKACSHSSEDEVYVLGNPPYLGARYQDKDQKADIQHNLGDLPGTNDLDYIACWFFAAAKYIENSNAKFGFVTTNSIIQGEQVSLLWPHIFDFGLEIFYAHQSFRWTNSAKKNAVVTCAIVGVRNVQKGSKYIFNGSSARVVKNISPYLTNNENVIVFKRSNPIGDVPKLVFGNQSIDGGFLILSDSEKQEVVKSDSRAIKFLRKLYSAEDYIDGVNRWCIWVNENNLKEASQIKEFSKRFQAVKKYREEGGEVARSLASIPFRFRYVHEAKSSILVVPRTTSERRKYIPIGFLDSKCIVTDAAQVIYDPDIFIFGILSSQMHMAWVRTVAGRLKTDFRYSNQLCYNSFPFPEIASDNKAAIEKSVLEILACRESFSDKSLGELYDPDKMPARLLELHLKLDHLVDSLYSKDGFKNDDQRLEFLFNSYRGMVGTND